MQHKLNLIGDFITIIINHYYLQYALAGTPLGEKLVSQLDRNPTYTNLHSPPMGGIMSLGQLSLLRGGTKSIFGFRGYEQALRLQLAISSLPCLCF